MAKTNDDGSVYPDDVEYALDGIVESTKLLNFPFHDHCIREVFGPYLLDKWLKGDTLVAEDSDDDFFTLLNKAAAESEVYTLVQKGLIDIVVDEFGNEFISKTEKGKKVLVTPFSDRQALTELTSNICYN
jgi:hypothetical protein